MILYIYFILLRVHKIFVAFNIRNKDNHNDDSDEKNKNNIIPILRYYYTRKSGARTLRSYAHIISILWYLGYARHLNNIKYPWTKLIRVILNADNRLMKDNSNKEIEVMKTKEK